MEKDLLIVGGGPGGYVAAIRAAQLGRQVTLVEREELGGTCLNHGCIPTKALYKNAEVLDELSRAQVFGISFDGAPRLDLQAVRNRAQKVVKTLTGGVGQLLKGNGVEVIRGEAQFVDSRTVQVNGERYTAKHILIATGSKPACLPIEGIDSPGVMDSTAALRLEDVPDHLLIIGGGVVGIEMAGIYQAFGSQVTVVEFMPTILPMVDGEVAKFFARGFAKRGIRILTSARVVKIAPSGEGLSVSVEQDGQTQVIPCDKVLSCAGRVANVDGLALDKAGVVLERPGIKVDENYQTNVKGIYAIGDVTGRVMLAHVASDEGKVCVERMAGHNARVNYDVVPNCIFTFPELASVGKTEEELTRDGVEYTASKFAFAGNGKALTLNATDGFVKVLAGSDDLILGVHIMGAHASDLIHEAIVAMHAQLTAAELATAMHAHPTLAEAVAEAAMGINGTAIHRMPARKR